MKFIFERFFGLSEIKSKSCFILAINQIASSLVIENHSDRTNVLWAQSLDVSTPFLLVVAAAAGVVNQKVASMGLKIRQRVAIGLAVFPFPQIYSFQNSYGFRVI